MIVDNGGKKPRPDSTKVNVNHHSNGHVKSDSKAEEDDPWSLPELTDTGVPWSGKLFVIFFNACS